MSQCPIALESVQCAEVFKTLDNFHSIDGEENDKPYRQVHNPQGRRHTRRDAPHPQSPAKCNVIVK